MKQHITMEQLSDLSVEQQEKLRIMIGDPRKNSTRMSMTPEERFAYELYFDLPQLSIGTMIELLNDRAVFISFDKLTVDEFILNDGPNSIRGSEPCDVLWQAVKSELNK